MYTNVKIFVAGHTGLLDSALVRKVKTDGYQNIITQTHKELALTNQLLSFFLLGVYSASRGWSSTLRMWCELRKICFLFGDIHV